MRIYGDKINRLPDERRYALYRGLAAGIAAKDGLDFDKVREFGASGGGPNKHDFEKAASPIIDFLLDTELTLDEIKDILTKHAVLD